MSRSFRLYVLAAGLAGLCLAAASAGERVKVNETVLDCVPEGCFVVRYVPAPRLKPEQDQGRGAQSESAEITAQNDKRNTDKSALTLVEQPESALKKSNADGTKSEEKNGSPVKRWTVGGWLWGLVKSAEALTAWGTIAGAVIAAVAVCLLYHTLKATQLAARMTGATLIEAKRTTKAAVETTNETRRIGEAQGRSYLAIEPKYASFDYASEERDSYRYAKLGIGVRVFGDSPVYSVRCKTFVQFQNHDLHTGSEINPKMTMVANSEPFLVSGREYDFSFGGGGAPLDNIIWEDLFLKAKQRSQSVYAQFTVRIFWTDIFNVEMSQRYDIWAYLGQLNGSPKVAKFVTAYVGPLKRERVKDYND